MTRADCPAARGRGVQPQDERVQFGIVAGARRSGRQVDHSRISCSQVLSPDKDPGPFDAAAVGSYRAAARVWQLTAANSPEDGYADESGRSRGEPDQTG